MEMKEDRARQGKRKREKGSRGAVLWRALWGEGTGTRKKGEPPLRDIVRPRD